MTLEICVVLYLIFSGLLSLPISTNDGVAPGYQPRKDCKSPGKPPRIP